MRFRFLLLSLALIASPVFAQNSAPVAVNLPNLTVRPGTGPITIALANNFSDPDLTSVVGTQVRFNTTLGVINMEMFDSNTPITVANFLNYINSGRYANVIWYHTIPGVVTESGYANFRASDNTIGFVTTFPAIQNEPGISNTRGTVAMSKPSTDPNSATSAWYVNLANNGGAPQNLDTLAGGYTVFGRVIEGGMTTVDAIAAVPTYNTNGGFFPALPLRNYTPGQNATAANFIFLGNTIQTGPKMTFTAQSNNTGILPSPALNGTVLTFNAGASSGTATLTVTGTDFNGLSAASTSTVSVSSTAPFGNLLNISTRAVVGLGENVMIGGFVVRGTGTKRLLIRVLGSELTARGVPNVLADPNISVYQGSTIIQTNDSWAATQQAAIAATGFAPTDPLEPAALVTVGAGGYTVIVRGAPNTAGTGLVEVYELDSTDTAKLINVSTRGSVGTNAGVMIGGFVIGGTTPKRVIIRAVGPSLAASGVVNPLLDPSLLVYSGSTIIARNDNWATGTDGNPNPDSAAITASGFQPISSQESAVILTLPPGGYTAIVSGVGGNGGVGLVEVFDLD